MQPQVAKGIAETSTSGSEAKASARARRTGGKGWSYSLTSWLGLVPFLLFCLLFEILPAIIIIQGSFTDNNTGAPTLDNYRHMFSTQNLHAFQTSISISVVTALIGGVFGGLAAYGVYNLRTGWLRVERSGARKQQDEKSWDGESHKVYSYFLGGRLGRISTRLANARSSCKLRLPLPH